ncbi:hypothetical protein ACFST9_21155 [Hymenobacter monticola]|uniref:Uncharacterized protein n=1 Tax=Hymenobacter monticola TaxID=1705399 RepID=A0ABY4B9F0_9BACT|nr:hypothetical protein [Hymenobacter monticola]UOE34393.1 hypothetical protein MTP16_01755 [Hymenobacter monticola]
MQISTPLRGPGYRLPSWPVGGCLLVVVLLVLTSFVPARSQTVLGTPGGALTTLAPGTYTGN